MLIRIASISCCLSLVIFVVADDDVASNSKIRELQSQKLELLEDIVTRYKFGYSMGKPVLGELLAAEHELLHAKLDIANSQADRVRLLELIVENRGRTRSVSAPFPVTASTRAIPLPGQPRPSGQMVSCM